MPQPTGFTHWCYRCNLRFAGQGQLPICPCCNDRFIIRLSDQEANYYNRYFEPRVRALTSDNGDRRRRSRLEVAIDTFMRNVMGSPDPADMRLHIGPAPFSLDRNHDNNNTNGSNTSNDQEPLTIGYVVQTILMNRIISAAYPPAPQTAIDAMPTSRITSKHLEGDKYSHCPVCKEPFELGVEIHNTCPVCRYELHETGGCPAGTLRGTNTSKHVDLTPSSKSSSFGELSLWIVYGLNGFYLG
ncbi:probable E3 ubiquitin-protein ligase RHC1A [Carica papaya]|uniref:probable E3 ubiquitin-protein ligase RHC1A n=1 Tax=Carica papaya TaxID=3649 RepID=UPI000B8CD7AA|nr:probable E3 ubiquitin-protein ligase RHC1A [Carica papaya]